jgi:hypothetical protein
MSTLDTAVARTPAARPEPVHLEPVQLAQLALAFQHRLDHLPDSTDPSWTAWVAMRSALEPLAPSAARRRAMASLFSRRCGPLPDLPTLATPGGRLALLDRHSLLSRLCTLALLSRPGVMRCCIERRTRQAIESALGPALRALRAAANDGPVVPASVAAWMPIQWACVGYADLERAGVWSHRSLRRMVRLALPARWPVLLSAVPSPHVPTPDALRRLHVLYEGAPSW